MAALLILLGLNFQYWSGQPFGEFDLVKHEVVPTLRKLEADLPPIQGNILIETFPSGAVKSFSHQITFALAGRSMLFTERQRRKETVVGVNAQYVFALEKEPDRSQYSYRFVKKITELSPLDWFAVDASRYWVLFSLSLAERRLSDLLLDDATSVIECEPVPAMGPRVYRLQLLYAPSKSPVPPASPPFQATLHLDGSRNWCLCQASIIYKRKDIAVEYGNDSTFEFASNNISWLPQKVHTVLWSAGDGGKTRRTLIFSDIRPHSLPEAAFTLSAFGLPEPFGIEWEKPTPWWLYAGITAGVVVLLIFLLGIWKRRLLARG